MVALERAAGTEEIRLLRAENRRLRERLAELRDGIAARTTTPEQMLVRSARKVLGLSQPRFADLIQIPVATLHDWEQGRFTPPGAVLAC